MLTGSSQNLTAIGFALTEDSGNLGILVLKDLAEKEHRPLNRRQAFQQYKKRHGKGLIDPYDFQRIASWIGHERFGQPLAHILLALYARRLQVIDTQTADDGDQECPRRSNVVIGGLLPADKGLLQLSSASATLPSMR